MNLSDLPFGVQIGLGLNTAIQQNRKFGNNSDVDTGTLPEDLWNGGGVYTGHNATGAEIVTVVSSSVNDTSAGTGARTIQLVGLDANYLPISETVTLNGTSTVDTVNSYLRLDRGIILTAGSGKTNAGTITARQKVTTANIFFALLITENQTHVGCFTIPAGYTGFIVACFFGVNKPGSGGGTFDRSAGIDIYARPLGGVYNSKFHTSVTSGHDVDHHFQVPIVLTEKTDVVMRCDDVSNDSTDVSGQCEYFLIANDLVADSVD